jgi:GH25 family lysozyme M1 (1,4-beta-N-acetylmuramidase)
MLVTVAQDIDINQGCTFMISIVLVTVVHDIDISRGAHDIDISHGDT